MIRILIVDDQNLVREGIKILLEKAREIKIVGEAKSGSEALQKIETLKPDVVLLDIEMPDVDGLDVADKIRSQFPQIKIIMLSSHEESSYVKKATNSGAKGYLLKSVSSHELEWSVRLVNSGYSAIKSELLQERLDGDSKSAPETANLNANLKNSLNKGIYAKAKAATSNGSNGSNSSNSSNGAYAKARASSPNSPRTMSAQPRTETNDYNQLENLLLDNQLAVRNIEYRRKRKKKKFIHSTRFQMLRKTMSSFEFKLLILIILFSLGFLTFVALS